MSRAVCHGCNKPPKACICRFFTTVDNQIAVVILQHKSEIKQSKATVPLLTHSLTDCKVIVGEDFSDNAQLNALLHDENIQCILLYPNEHSQSLTQWCAIEPIDENKRDQVQQKTLCLILLDGTWKKAYRMYQLSTNLHELIHCHLPENIEGQYAIRQTQKAHALSTLEACCHALAYLENAPQNYQKLLDNFVDFNTFHLTFRPPLAKNK